MNEPIRIAQVVGKWVGGGVEAVVMNYYRHIDHSKIQFDFICDSDSTCIPYEEIEKLGGRVYLVPPYQKVFKYHFALKKLLKENNYHIVHSHINTLSVFSLFAAKMAGIPVRIAHSHSATNPKEFKRNLFKQILRPFSKIFATDYMCCSEMAGRWQFGNKTYDKHKVYLLNNAVDLNHFCFDSDIRKSIRKSLDIKDDMVVLGHAGRFVTVKNHRFIVELFNKYHKLNPNSKLLLIGQGPLLNEIKNLVNSYSLNDSVVFLGQRSDVNVLYQAIDFFLLPSLYEGLGLALVEAQIAGCYAISSTNVPKKAQVGKNISFIDLDKMNAWLETITINLDYKRVSPLDEAKKLGFDIDSETEKLEKYYLNK